MLQVGREGDTHTTHPLLSTLYFTAVAIVLPILPNLLAIRTPSIRTLWDAQGVLVNN